jgi:hypothetical protein
MTEMSKSELNRFLSLGTFTAKLATVKEDGSPHVAPYGLSLMQKTILFLERKLVQLREKISRVIQECVFA